MDCNVSETLIMVSSMSDVLLTTLDAMNWQKDLPKHSMGQYSHGDREACDLKFVNKITARHM